MISEFSVKAKPSNNKARILFIACMMSSFAFITISTLIPIYKGLVSLTGVAFLCAALILYTKYIAPIYYYDIILGGEGEPLLVVRQQTGKRYTTLCRIFLSEIVKIEKENDEQRRAHKISGDTLKYSYLPSLCPSESYRITTVSSHERAEILIECSDEFADLLGRYSNEAKEMHIDTNLY
ncbi:MAG: hypothetical protein J6V80_05875 [Clostridia bacterium]|nr:hypothetical protein [Clostridia bacterium]